MSDLSVLFWNTSSTEQVAELLSRSKQVLIYGAGNVGRKVADIFEKASLPVTAIIDQDAAYKRDDWTLPVYTLEEASSATKNKNSAVVVVAVFNRESDTSEIVDNCLRHGFSKTVSFVSLVKLFERELGEVYWISSNASILEVREELEEAYSLLSDEESRRLFFSTLNFRLSGDYSDMPLPDAGPQYFDQSIKGLRKPEIFVDCGAFTGDTVLGLFRAYGKVKSILAFEPDPENFRLLLQNTRDLRESVADFFIPLPLGVWSEVTQLTFSAGSGESSRLVEKGLAVVQCTSLDAVLRHCIPDYVKIDVEGADLEAIEGERELMREHAPNQAVCLYHRPDHLWQIPLLIHSINPTYHLYLRSYYYNGFDTVLYALA